MSDMVQRFKEQFRSELDRYQEQDPTCAYAAGMLLILSALRRYDGPTLPMQVAAMHTALRQIGEERGWYVDKAGGA